MPTTIVTMVMMTTMICIVNIGIFILLGSGPGGGSKDF